LIHDQRFRSSRPVAIEAIAATVLVAVAVADCHVPASNWLEVSPDSRLSGIVPTRFVVAMLVRERPPSVRVVAATALAEAFANSAYGDALKGCRGVSTM
jgi:hypothetical protein